MLGRVAEQTVQRRGLAAAAARHTAARCAASAKRPTALGARCRSSPSQCVLPSSTPCRSSWQPVRGQGAAGLARAFCSGARAEDPYQVLGVTRTATPEEVKQAYRRLALKWHPDRNPDNQAEAETRFKSISRAYALLSDSDRRTSFDHYGTDFSSGSGVPSRGGVVRQHYTQAEAAELFRQTFGDKPIPEILRDMEEAMKGAQEQRRIQEEQLEKEAQRLQGQADALRLQAQEERDVRKKVYLHALAVQKDNQARMEQQRLWATRQHNKEQQLYSRILLNRVRSLDPFVQAQNRIRAGVAWGSFLGSWLVLRYTLFDSLLIGLGASLTIRLVFIIWQRMQQRGRLQQRGPRS